MAERELVVRIIGDDRDLKRALGSSEREVKGFQGRLAAESAAFGRSFLPAAAGAAAGAGAIAILQKSITQASNLNEQLSKSRQIFGDASRDVEEWARTTSSSFGISNAAALEATGTFGNLFRVVGLVPRQAADMSRALVELSADLASFNNADPSEVLIALRSGLIGEAEPLRRFGVLLSEARVQERALADTGKENIKALTNQEKTLARYEIILHDTAAAQGDFERTSEGLANQQRILNAQIADLEANLGRALIPTLTDLVSTLNDVTEGALILTDALRDLKDLAPIEIPVDIPVKLIFAGRTVSGIQGLAGDIGDVVGDAVESAFSAGVGPFKALEDRLKGGGGRGFTFFPAPADDAADQLEKDSKKTTKHVEDKAASAKREQERQSKAFDSFVKGIGLKIDKARLTQGVGDDLAAFRELERAILRQIDREGKTFDLVQQLTDTRLQISSIVERQADDARQAGEDAFSATLDALDLQLEIAQSTRSLADDQAVLRQIEAAIISRIASEGRTTDLLRQLFQVRQEQVDVARQLREQQRERRQGQQFEALGLTSEGEERVPGQRVLRRRANQLEEQIKGTVLDTENTRRKLERIQAVLAGKFGQVGREVRRAILEMLNTISDALNEGNRDLTGPLTKTTSLNSRRILQNLGLTEEQERELRARLSNFNSAGVGFAGANQTTRTGSFQGGTRENIVIENNVTVEIDGKKITATVTKQQQKARRRNPLQKRGPNRAGHGGH